MDESDVSPILSEKQKIKALKLVVTADGYLAQRQLLTALNLYKESAEILPDPAIIHKIKKLRKYMKRNGMDLGEHKENQPEHKSSEKQVSPDIASKQQESKNLIEHNVDTSSNLSKDNPKAMGILVDKLANIKLESASFEEQENQATVLQRKYTEPSLACSPVTVKEEATDDGDECQQKRDIKRQKLKSTSSDLLPKSSHGDGSLSKMAPSAKLNTPAGGGKISPTSVGRIQCFKDLRRHMYPHQKEGMKWLARLFGSEKGGILGDDMGLGKTLQVIGYLYKMFEVNEIEHVLIVLPTALVLPWQSEIKRWAPDLNYALFHGKSRASRLKTLHNLQRQGGLLLTTYGLIVTNYEELSKGPDKKEFVWDYVFLDEGHKIKNPTKTQKAAHYIPAHNRIIITGTPIQNNLVEMWSLFDFVHHGSLLGTIKTFKMKYENPITRARQKDASLEEKQLGYRMAQNLQKIIAPYFLRRTKAELMMDPNSGIPKLPHKNDLIIWVKMTEDQKKVYESYLKLEEVKELMSSSRSPLVALIILKKICDHLRLLSMRICKALGLLTAKESNKYTQDNVSHLDDPAEIPEWTRQPEAEEPPIPTTLKQVKEADCAATQLTGIPDSILYRESSKLMVVIELLSYLSATGHKCLVFSQSAKMLNIIQQILTNMHFRYVRMDGSITNLEQRAEIIRRFETKDIPIFLLTTQVGGVGLNLTVADRIIIVDPSWNPAIDSQAVDRIYRIGQTKNVIIFRLITCGSVEEKIYIRQLFKLSINKQTTKESKDPFRYFTRQDLKQLFIVDDLSVSETQLQLAEMHSSKRVSNEVVDDQIKFLESMEAVFGVSDHDLVFSTEDGDQEIQVTNSRLQTMVEKAEEAIRNEINEESRANSKKVMPGFQERRIPSVETASIQPTKSLSSPLFTMYSDEGAKTDDASSREVRRRRSNIGHNTLSTSPVTVVLSDTEPTPGDPKENGKDDDIILLSDSHSESSDVIMDSEDEKPSHLRPSVNQAMDDKVLVSPTKMSTQNVNLPDSSCHSQGLNSSIPSFINKTFMSAVADSPISPAKSGLKNVLVADSPDNFTKSVSSSSQHSSDSLSPTKVTVAESDYDSAESFLEQDIVETTDNSLKNRTSIETKEDDSQKFCSPPFRDLSVVVPDSPQSKSLQDKNQTTPPLSTDQFGELHESLTLDDTDLVRSVKQNRCRVLSSSESELEPDSEAEALGPSFDSSKKPGNKRDTSSEINEDFDNVHCSFSEKQSNLKLAKSKKKTCVVSNGSSSEEEENESATSESDSFSGKLSKRQICKAKRFVLLSSDDDEDDDGASSKTADNSKVVLEELNISTHPTEPMIRCVQTPPAKIIRLEKSLMLSSEREPYSSPAKVLFTKEEKDSRLEVECDRTGRKSDDSEDIGSTSIKDEEGQKEENDSGEEGEEEENDSGEEEEEEESDSGEEGEEESDSIEDNEEEGSDSIEEEEEEEDEKDNIELPETCSEKTELYNEYIKASRDAYYADDYVGALKNSLRALHEDSSDITLQMYAIWLRKMTKK